MESQPKGDNSMRGSELVRNFGYNTVDGIWRLSLS